MNSSFNRLLTALAILSSQIAFSQEGAPALASVTYESIHVNDTNHRDQPIKEQMILRLSQHDSRYSSLTNENNIKNSRKKAASEAPAGPVRTVSGGPLAVVTSPGLTLDEFFQIPSEKKLNTTSTLGMRDYLVETALPQIDWKISEETRKIGDFSCQKAVGEYAGRTYTAWFTTDLPFQNGPWKLSGLPGLILEASDSRNEVSFIFKDISKDPENETTKSAKRKLIKASEKDVNRLKEAFYKDPVAGMQSQVGVDGPPVKLAYHDASGKSYMGDEAQTMIEKMKNAEKNNNNPIELTSH